MATNNNLYAPPKTRTAGPPDAPKKARGAARWMRVLGAFFVLFGASVLGLGVLSTQMTPAPSVAIMIAALGFSALVSTVFGFLGGWLLHAASRIRRGFAEQSGAVLASAFVPLRRYFIAAFAAHSLVLFINLWIA